MLLEAVTQMIWAGKSRLLSNHLQSHVGMEQQMGAQLQPQAMNQHFGGKPRSLLAAVVKRTLVHPERFAESCHGSACHVRPNPPLHVRRKGFPTQRPVPGSHSMAQQLAQRQKQRRCCIPARELGHHQRLSHHLRDQIAARGVHHLVNGKRNLSPVLVPPKLPLTAGTAVGKALLRTHLEQLLLMYLIHFSIIADFSLPRQRIHKVRFTRRYHLARDHIGRVSIDVKDRIQCQSPVFLRLVPHAAIQIHILHLPYQYTTQCRNCGDKSSDFCMFFRFCHVAF